MLKLRHYLFLLLLASPLVNAMNGVIWQPQLRDTTVSPTQWTALMQNLHRQGFDTLVLQWTQYGTAFSNAQDSQWLQLRADAARKAGLKVIVGLHADPDFFSRQKQSAAALSHYLTRLRMADLRQAKAWNPVFQPDGWYISAEIDDLNWRNPAARAQLIQWLRDTRQQFAALDTKPLYISSFFAGHMTPEGYSRMLAEIRQTGVQVWVQDGYGVDKLTPTERQRYLTASAGCEGLTPASGTVYELFKTLPGKTFSAEPLPTAAMKSQLAARSECNKDRLYFSLRYLPAANGILPWKS